MPSRHLAIPVLAISLAFGASAVHAIGIGDRPSRHVDARTDRSDAQMESSTPDARVLSKAGIDRFDLDVSKVRESRKADGTVIIELNGEGMEKATLTMVGGAPGMSCGSPLELAPREARRPLDFRRVGPKPGVDDAHR